MGSGHKPLKKTEVIATPSTLHCLCCNDVCASNEFYSSDSELHRSVGKIPYCRKCLNEFYEAYLTKYKASSYLNPERKAIERLCMVLDIYYSDKIFDSAVKLSEAKQEATLFALYLKQAKLYQYRNKNYDTTIQEKYNSMNNDESSMSVHTKQDGEQNELIKCIIQFNIISLS